VCVLLSCPLHKPHLHFVPPAEVHRELREVGIEGAQIGRRQLDIEGAEVRDLDSLTRTATGRIPMMSKHTGPYMSDGTTIRTLARAIGRLVQTDGDHCTRIPALTLHRRSGPTEPLHCIYNLGLGVVAQGDKQVLQLRRDAAARGLDASVWFVNVERVTAETIGRETVPNVSNIYKYDVSYLLVQGEYINRRNAKKTSPGS